MDKQKLITKVREILKGIDEDNYDSDNGWWPTSTGVEFGSNKLKDLIAAIEDA